MKHTSSHIIKITGVSDELLALLDSKIKQQHATGRAEYLRELIRKDVLSPENREPFYKTASHAEWSKRLRAWAESNEPDAPNLSEKSIRRKDIYDKRAKHPEC